MTKMFTELSLWKHKGLNGQFVKVINLLSLFRVVILPIIPMDVIYNSKKKAVYCPNRQSRYNKGNEN